MRVLRRLIIWRCKNVGGNVVVAERRRADYTAGRFPSLDSPRSLCRARREHNTAKGGKRRGRREAPDDFADERSEGRADKISVFLLVSFSRRHGAQESVSVISTRFPAVVRMVNADPRRSGSGRRFSARMTIRTDRLPALTIDRWIDVMRMDGSRTCAPWVPIKSP